MVDESKKRAEQEELVDARSEFEISLILALRTGVSGFASCCFASIDSNNSADEVQSY